MTTNAVTGLGTTLQKGDGATPEVFTTVSEVHGINGPTQDADVIEVTSLASPNGTKEFIAGLKNAGTVTFDINFNPTSATHAALFADQKSGIVRNWKIVLPSSVSAMTFSFAAFVKSFTADIQAASHLKANLTLHISGAVTLA